MLINLLQRENINRAKHNHRYLLHCNTFSSYSVKKTNSLMYDLVATECLLLNLSALSHHTHWLLQAFINLLNFSAATNPNEADRRRPISILKPSRTLILPPILVQHTKEYHLFQSLSPWWTLTLPQILVPQLLMNQLLLNIHELGLSRRRFWYWYIMFWVSIYCTNWRY